MIEIFEKLAPNDKVALLALGVAVGALLVSLIPAITSIVQAWVAYLAYRKERETREPAVNISTMVPQGWPADCILLNMSVTNRSDFFIEVRRIRLIAPKPLRIAIVRLAEPISAIATDVPLNKLVFEKSQDMADTLVRPLGSTQWVSVEREIAANMHHFRIALRVPESLRSKLLVKMRVDIARSNRHMKPTVLPVHFEIKGWEWNVSRA